MGQTSEMTENSCRLCDESCTSMHSVFERAPEGQQVLHLIKDCLHLLIYRTDPLPKYICESCYTSLLNFSSFKRISYETLERQTEKLRENINENISVKLFLNALEQDNFQANDKHKSHNSQNIIIGTNYFKENRQDNESELCAELHKAINDSMQKSKIQQNHMDTNQCLFINGDMESQDEDSHVSNSIRNFHGTESPFSISQNAESQSDMELCESDSEYAPKIITVNITGKRLFSELNDQGPITKKRRFVGPKSRIRELKENYLRLVQKHEAVVKKKIVKYNPLSLMGCILNHINKMHIPNYVCENYKKVELDCVVETPIVTNGDIIDLQEENICNYCDRLFMNTNSLALHESSHMYVVLGRKVDERRMWTKCEADAIPRNLWYNSNKEHYDDRFSVSKQTKIKELINFDDSSGRVNVIDPADVDFKEKYEDADEDDGEAEANNDHQALLVAKDICLKGEVVLIDTRATVNGVLLSDIPKDDRRTLYKSVTVNSVKRKFCPLCRYTFKDNWAIESHYFSNACHYTCRFCGVRFNKQRHEFDNHIRQHIMSGDMHTTKVFASRKFNSLPRVIDETKMKTRLPPTPRGSYNYTPKNKPSYTNDIFVKNFPRIKAEPRSESSSPTPTKENIKTEGKPQNQAYFCRKCYQVFFKLDEFNVHVVTCRGTGFANNTSKTSPNIRQYTPPIIIKKEPEKISSSGRPMRNCVREIGTYADDPQEEVEVSAQFGKLSGVRSPRGYECGLCSSCFPTVHSRNSHMRIHKAHLHALSNKSISITKNRPENIAKKIIKIESHGGVSSYTNFMNIPIKQEPMEPIVEIHEQPSTNNYSSGIGAVSITPLPNASQKTMLDPSIIRLVQNNPNLTIKGMADSHIRNRISPMSSPVNHSSNQNQDGELKCYRCLSCSKPFANKSNLYFHKKNQCSGSKYPCPFCKKRFGTEAAYSSHIFYNHPE